MRPQQEILEIKLWNPGMILKVQIKDLQQHNQDFKDFLNTLDEINFQDTKLYISDSIYERVIAPFKAWYEKMKLLGYSRELQISIRQIQSNNEKDITITIGNAYQDSRIQLLLPKSLRNIELNTKDLVQLTIEDLSSIYMSSETIGSLIGHIMNKTINMDNSRYIIVETALINKLNKMLNLVNNLDTKDKIDADYKKILYSIHSIYINCKMPCISTLIESHSNKTGIKSQKLIDIISIESGVNISVEIKKADRKRKHPADLSDLQNSISNVIQLLEIQIKNNQKAAV